MFKKFICLLVILVLVILNIKIELVSSYDELVIHDYNYLCGFYGDYEDMESPVMVLNGSDNIYLDIGSQYYELGVKSMDNCDGDLTNKVKVYGKVNTDKEGIYKIKYEIVDHNNNYNHLERNVYVRDNDMDDKGVIYLTFDDGPSNSITPKILDILKKEDVKATFFVINHLDNDYLIKRISDEGHVIGLHSYSHDYSYVYSSVDNYFNDLELIENKVYKLTGVSSNIIRFPGGSSNLVSKKYMNGIMSELVKEVYNRGYIYYDWNIESNDSGGVKSSDEVYNNVVNNLSLDKVNMVLLHDFENNYYTLEALPKIIKYAKDNGYKFDVITSNTKQIKHVVNN